MSGSVPEFDDPALKAALHQAMAGESAPPGLHDRIATAINAQAKTHTRRMVLMAIAASIILVGGASYFLRASNELPAPTSFVEAMIVAHNLAKTSLNRNLLNNIPNSDLPALRAQYRQVLGYPALVAMLNDGWQFREAGISEINGTNASHLVFTRGTDRISLFSIKAHVLFMGRYYTEDGTYAQTQQGFQVAGFVAGGAVHCLVCESPTGDVSLRQVIRLRNQLRQDSPELGS